MVWSGYAVLMSGKTDSIKINNNTGCLPGSTFLSAICLHRHVLPTSLACLRSTLKGQTYGNQREAGNTLRVWVVVVLAGREPSYGRPYGERAKLWSSLQGESQVVVIPTGKDPSDGRPYEERAKLWSSLWGESQVFYGVSNEIGLKARKDEIRNVKSLTWAQ
ncbi:hypothetical protein Tco_1200098 [Tanacetum coccineum]